MKKNNKLVLYFAVFIIVLGIIFSLSKSYAYFETSIEATNATLCVGKLYNNLSEIYSLDRGEIRKIDFLLETLNEIDNKYKIYYEVLEGDASSIGVKYKSGEQDFVNGTISPNKTLSGTIFIVNNSTENIKVKIGVLTGLVNNEVELGENQVAISEEFKEVPVIVTLDANGGIVDTSTLSLLYDVRYGELPMPTKDGYIFEGWYNEDNIKITSDMLVENFEEHTLTAKWSASNYIITYDLAGGTLEEANPTSYNIETETFLSNNPVKSGYNFLGWTGSNGETASTSVSIEKGSTGNKNYTANWKLAPLNLINATWTHSSTTEAEYSIQDSFNQTSTSIYLDGGMSSGGTRGGHVAYSEYFDITDYTTLTVNWSGTTLGYISADYVNRYVQLIHEGGTINLSTGTYDVSSYKGQARIKLYVFANGCGATMTVNQLLLTTN